MCERQRVPKLPISTAFDTPQDLGVDAFLSVPPEKLAALNGVVKESFAGLEATSCTLVPLPSAPAPALALALALTLILALAL